MRKYEFTKDSPLLGRNQQGLSFVLLKWVGEDSNLHRIAPIASSRLRVYHSATDPLRRPSYPFRTPQSKLVYPEPLDSARDKLYRRVP